ncbi:uncharacterized protein LOC129773609 [Toxorhynchites rutilus septentrionalis]|uniref:uncharacterized protein LOC129773609 n=1 Tax=Toxorhynchites rutilus septentrionalis TaxID=329112 RepID=UPI0024789CB0|nr:uncharacterized protein LOC129773609 [Toxorhynchites rutilus septentrionalis]
MKPPSKRSIITTYTEERLLNGEKMICCVLGENCLYEQKVFRQSNFERHFRLCHPVEYDRLCIGPSAAKSSSPNMEPAITIRMTKQRLVGGIIKMVAIHGLPFEATEWEGFREVVDPLLRAYNLTINRHNITQYVTKAAEGIDWMIGQALNGKLISLKLDIVSKMYRSMLGINCQYINNSGIVVKRNLGIIELHNRHTSQNIKEELVKVLKTFNVEMWQIMSITIDNASNMVKLVDILSDEIEYLLEVGFEYRGEVATDDITTFNELDADDDFDTLDDSLERPAVLEWVRVLEEFAPNAFITAIRCGAHTTQSVVHDVCKEIEPKDILKEIRKKVKKFRSTEYKAFFDVSEGGSYPPLPNETRWNSDYKMLHELIKRRTFFEKLGTQYSVLDLSNYWNFIKEYVTAFNPLYQCTTAVQKLELSLSDFYIEWIRAYGSIRELEGSNRFKTKLINVKL